MDELTSHESIGVTGIDLAFHITGGALWNTTYNFKIIQTIGTAPL